MMRFVLMCLLAPGLVLLFANASQAQQFSQHTSARTADGPVIEFTEGEFVLANGLKVPTSGWKRAANPHIIRLRETDWRTGDFHTMAGRFHFPRSALGDEPLALYTVSTRNQFSVVVNGREIGRNFARPTDQIMAWYRPYLVPLPTGVLVAGTNVIEIRVSSEDSVGVGRVMIGPNTAIRDKYNFDYFWQITAPMAANFAMIVLGFLGFLFCLGRRQDIEIAWLSISTALWLLRNYQFYAEVTPFSITVFNA